MARPRIPLETRFRNSFAEGASNECWLWQRKLYRDRQTGRFWYGIITSGGHKGRDLRAHRVAWEVYKGPIPPTMHVLHHCDNPVCVNPAHLFLGTQADNNLDKTSKGRNGHVGWICGEQHGMSKLTEEKVRYIRAERLNGRTLKSLAAEIGVAYTIISRVARRESWKHII